ncbi:MAG: PASTA domain-containing protein [Sporichthyaceae bacterium]
MRIASRLALPVIAAALLAGCGTDTVDQISARGGGGGESPSPQSSAPAAEQSPAGFRFVGIDRAAIAVPDAWGTNKIHCGTPIEDTVVVDQGGVCLALVPRPAGVESVDIRRGNPHIDTGFDEVFEIDGVRAERQATVCAEQDFGKKVVVCTGAVRIPSTDAVFEAQSSTDGASVEEILGRIRMVSGLVAVPEHRTRQTELQEDSQAAYLQALEDAGLQAQIVTRRISGMEGGHVLDTKPESGTMVRPGETVTVTVSAAPRSPADEISVGMNSSGPGPDGEYGRGLDDEEIRGGKAVLRVQVGGRVWAYGKGENQELIGETEGNALEPSTWAKDPNKGRSWEAAKPGTSKVTLILIVDGERYELGTVTVEVYR